MTITFENLTTDARERLLQKAKRLGLKRRSYEAQSIGKADRSDPPVLSFAQQRLWFLCQMRGVSRAYHMSAGLMIEGVLERGALVKALDRIVARHETLRTCFVVLEGEPVQRIKREDIGFALQWHDLRGRADAEQELQRLAQQEAEASFDLGIGPLIRGRLIQLQDTRHVLLVTMHHIVSDGWSVGVLVRELNDLYGAFCRGESDPLPALAIQYADYAAWQRRWLSGE